MINPSFRKMFINNDTINNNINFIITPDIEKKIINIKLCENRCYW